jgi:hypothetical protein
LYNAPSRLLPRRLHARVLVPRVAADTARPDWDGTTVIFELVARAPDACELSFRHAGIGRDLVEPGWDRFLPSLVAFVEQSRGAPFTLETLDVVRAYRRAWTNEDFEEADPARPRHGRAACGGSLSRR